MEDIIKGLPELRMFVCVNDRSKLEIPRPSCGPTITESDVKEVKAWLKEQGLWGKIKVTKVLCFGFCNTDGGVCGIYPKGRYVKGLQSAEDIKQLLREEYPGLS